MSSDSESTSSAVTSVSVVGSPVIQDLDLDVVMDADGTAEACVDAKTHDAEGNSTEMTASSSASASATPGFQGCRAG